MKLCLLPDKIKEISNWPKVYLGQFGEVNLILMRGEYDITTWHYFVICRMVSHTLPALQ